MIPTPEQLAKLPKWARDHIAQLQSGCDELRQKLSAFENNDPSPFFERTIDGRYKYFRCDDAMTIVHSGVRLQIRPRSTDGRISLSWEGHQTHSEIALIPYGHQQAYLVSKENMR